MKTLTEFDGFRLKNALTLKKELAAAGKTPEELPAALGEALKLEGDKLTLFLNALAVAEERTDHLKRVVVYAAEEGKSAPKGAVEKDGNYFFSEFFFVPQARSDRGAGHDRGRRDGKRGGKGRGKGGRGGRDGGRGGRGGSAERGGEHRGRDASGGGARNGGQSNGPRLDVTALANGGAPQGEGGDKARRPRRRRPRGPRREEGGATEAGAQQAGGNPKPAPALPKPNVIPVAPKPTES